MSAALQAQAAGNDSASNDPTGADLAAQQHTLDTLRDDGHISTEAHAIASHKIQADQAALLATRQQNDTQTLQRVWDLKNANPNAALTDLSSADYAYLKSRGLDASALAILQSHPASDDPALFNQLHRQATQDPVQFAKANLLAQSGKLSRAHMQTLQSLQDAINKQDPQAMQAGRQVEDAVGALSANLQAAGCLTYPRYCQPVPLTDYSLATIAPSHSGGGDEHLFRRRAQGGPFQRQQYNSLSFHLQGISGV